MLHFFRKHQKYFFIFTTLIIVSSFAFFGTYQAFAPGLGRGKTHDEIAFRTIDGKGVKRSYLDHMTRFLAREEWMHTAKIFDANYLNNGIVSKDFLEGGLSAGLVTRLGEEYRPELEARLAREINYKPYQHPYLPSLSAMAVWSLFAPEIPKKLSALQAAEDPVSSFDARIALFLAEKSFPPAFLTQVLSYQEREQALGPGDPRLQDAVSLFGYRDLNDWFGEKFVESIAKVVINTAAIARQKGYTVSREELLSDLLYKSRKTYEAISANVKLPVESGAEFFQLYLRYKGLDETTLLRVWEEISLFRRMMQDVGSAALVDALPLEQFYQFANEHATVELYQMAPEYRFQNEEEAKVFAAYLEVVAPNPSAAEIPSSLASVEKIEQRAPQLVGKRYRIYVGSLDKEALKAKVSTKETWEWELANWERLKTAFPELGSKEGTPFDILEKLESRKKIDTYAAAQIVEIHPEWIEESVKEAAMHERELFLSSLGDRDPLPGISDRGAFQKLLDTEDEVIGYTQDKKHYYRILVFERGENKEILPFKEAKGLLKPASTAPASFAAYLEKNRNAPDEAFWRIEKKEVKITRANPTFITLSEALALDDGQFSPVAVNEKEGPYCFRLKEVFVDTSVPMQKWIEAQEVLAKEMRAQFFENILTEICSKSSFL
ncbi:MAG: hypothetical protein JJU12_05330 [Chlamydiales bacterium]|nr:hypothetical protein [Chlamydiales bacterium]